MGRSRGGGNQTVQQTSEPWSVQKPHLTRIFDLANAQYNNSQRQPLYRQQMYAPFQTEQTDAQTKIANLANTGDAGVNAARNLNRQTIQGNYLYGGPGFNLSLIHI